MTRAGTAYYIEYADSTISHVSVPVLSKGVEMNASDAVTAAETYNLNPPKGYHATALNPSYFSPIQDVPALQNYRLVHESPTSVSKSNVSDIKYVKVFEYVKGAHIKGNGIIEVPVITNTGRAFTYRQQSVNGEFVVPYATSGSSSDVKTTGNYHIAGTSQSFDVPESAVEQGSAIN
jgi:dolichyl-diphosphooligosaccharide--protein glycosyltransferase